MTDELNTLVQVIGRLVPKILPTEKDTSFTAAQRLHFAAALHFLAMRCQVGLRDASEDQQFIVADAKRALAGDH